MAILNLASTSSMFATDASKHCFIRVLRVSPKAIGRPLGSLALYKSNLHNGSRCNASSVRKPIGGVLARQDVPTEPATSPSGRSFGSPEPLCGGGGSGGPAGRGPHPPGGSGGSGPGGSGDIPDDASGRGRMEPVTIFFGLFVLVGGVMGYKKKRSKDSLIASSIIAGLLFFSAYLMGKPNTTYGIRLALVTTGTLAAYMGKGYYDKRKVFPQGVLAVMSTLISIAYWGSIKNL